MITRAQAEALLTLAESLEACERLGAALYLSDSMTSIGVLHGGDLEWIEGDLTGAGIRLVVNSLMPKQEQTYTLDWEEKGELAVDAPRHEENARLESAAPKLLKALQNMLELERPLTGNPSRERLIEHWEYEQSQGNGAAEYHLSAWAAIAEALGE
ncbi:hypothetical protein D3C85_1383010 [compost metagenome]